MSGKESQFGTVTELTSEEYQLSYPTQTFHLLPLERFIPVGNQLYTESVVEVEMNSCRSSFFITLLPCLFFVALRESEVRKICLVSESRAT